MLVLSRKVGEALRLTLKEDGEIIDEMVVIVTDIHQGKVRIGIDADKAWKIKRDELTDKD